MLIRKQNKTHQKASHFVQWKQYPIAFHACYRKSFTLFEGYKIYMEKLLEINSRSSCDVLLR